MNKVGIVGGIGPEATVYYYQSIICKFQEKVGSKEELPELFINSINMYKMFNMLSKGQTEEVIQYLTDAVVKLESVGVDFVAMCGNTPHIVLEEIQQKVRVPIISIVEETYVKAQAMKLDNIGLIGTKFTMENAFFKEPFIANKIDMVVPNKLEQEYIHRKIVEELENGIVNEKTKSEFLSIINEMMKRDSIQGIVLGCTELPMLIKNEDLSIHSFNTAEIHINKIVDAIVME